ncbi:amidohydrolase family protein [Sphingomonas histidinilytica]|jgi:predicted TIM-barrel fold metal-dependent hydrolase|nr:amidohydrolase family protein [Rhizorhabdus histidinilytica]MBO9377063.1 amidohydrolase family protein [Rhizorhabdus histidinilytica]QEH80076.1 amidohydrolase family protein [Sphingomonas sp. C8-2]
MMTDTLHPSPPAVPLPDLACDAHAHVLGPYDRFPLAEDRSYTPPEATAAMHANMLDAVGFARGVFVQPTAYGDDNGCLIDAIAQAPRARAGIGVAEPEADIGHLAGLAAAGVRGLRFVEMLSQRYGGRPKGSCGFAELYAMAPRLREAGLHAQLFSKTETFAEHMPRLLDTGLPLVLDHMATVGKSAGGVDDPSFQTLLALLREGRIWVKLTVVRRSTEAPDYPDARAFHDALVDANPDRLLWGTDWPFVNMPHKPDIGRLIDLLDSWTADETIRRKIFVDNPAALYRFG